MLELEPILNSSNTSNKQAVTYIEYNKEQNKVGTSWSRNDSLARGSEYLGES